MSQSRFLIPGFVLGLVVVGAVFVALSANSASAHGVSPAQLGRAGWTCFNVPDLGVHCIPPGGMQSSASVSLRVFDTDDAGSADAPFLGTEILIRADLYAGQPCAQDGGGEYHFLPSAESGLPVDYYACHHYDTSE